MKRRAPSDLWGDHPAQLTHFTRVLPNGCWEFTGYVHPNGYGQLGRNIGAHRVAWEVANGRPVPDGLHVDHLCHNADVDCHDDTSCQHRRCVNPDHLEAVPVRINVIRGHGFAGANARATHCPKGHEFTPENIYYRPGRLGRMCRQCRYETGKGRSRALVNADSPVIRAWALENGVPIADRGAIPRRVRDLYEAEIGQQRAA